jgi:hypothetical protein
MLIAETDFRVLEEKFRGFCIENNISESKSLELTCMAIKFTHDRDLVKLPMTEVLSIRQHFHDGTTEVFSIGDETEDGKILEIVCGRNHDPHVKTDKPSEWHLQNGQDHGWNWTWLLRKV